MMFQVFQLVRCIEDFNSFHSDIVKQTKPALVMFYTPWCKHYQSFKNSWVNIKMDNVTFAQVDCMSNRDVCQEESIKDYPTLKLYKDGQFIQKYKGQRDLQKILSWLKDKTK